ncbi:MFS transporter [Kerstersia sp.]|uniref:MFS transporter n=1 Tax=Kerstersia sp. TaxID=1930783 RepID=UPI003F90DE1F
MSAFIERRPAVKISVVIGILLIASNLRAPFTALPPVLQQIQESFGLSTVATGALTTLPLLAFALLSPFSASFARKFGLERALFGALIAIAAGIALRSAGASWLLYLGTAAIGAGIAIGNVLLPSLVKRDFAHNVASLTGAYALTMGVAAALGSAAVIPLSQGLGWRPALLAFIVLPLAAMAVWMPQLGKHRAPAASHAAAPAAGGTVWRSALAWQVTLFLGLNSTIYYVIIGWLPAILVDAGLSSAQAGSLHGMLQLATAVPGLLLGPILRRMRDQRLAATSVCLFSAVALLGFYALPQFALIWALLFGVGSGAGVILGLAFIGLRTANAQQAASLSGMSQCVGYLLASLGPIAMGGIHDALHGWSVPLELSAALALGAAVMGLLAGRNLTIGSPADGMPGR